MNQLGTLQAYRALAAILVVFSHVGNISTLYLSPSPYSFLYPFGYAGVSFFFALSGFIMVWVHAADFEKPGRLGAYLRKRTIRIYPIYWVVTIALLPLWLFFPDFGFSYHREVGAFLKSLVLIPQTHPPHLSVGWTLSHEVLFYLTFATFFFSRKAGLLVFGLWAGAVVFSELGEWNRNFPLDFLFNEFNLLFPMGMITAFAARRSEFLKGWGGLCLFLTGNALFALGLILEPILSRFVHLIPILGFASCLILAGAMNDSVENFFRRRKELLFLGSASYALYLAHYPAMSMAGKLYGAAGGWDRLPPWYALPVLLVAAVLSGVALHVGVERPLAALFAKPREMPRA